MSSRVAFLNIERANEFHSNLSIVGRPPEQLGLTLIADFNQLISS
jgi:hypothetical protein